MDLILFFQAIFLGIVEGLTEFIPVSSTGHLILTIDLIGFKGPPGKVFEIVIQLGAILSVCYVYREKLLHTALNLHKEKGSYQFARNVTLAFIPSVIIGLLAHDFIKKVLFSPYVVSISLILGGILILLVERSVKERVSSSVEKLSAKMSFYIGLCQTISMIPGVSRSGATIIGAMLMGVDRKTATEFSFFLAIPTMFGATAYDIYENYSSLNMDNFLLIAVGFIAAFFSALLVVRKLISFVSEHGFSAFGWYRIIIGSIMLLFLL